MGELFEKLRAATGELNDLDKLVVLALRDLILDAAEAEALTELWPDAKPMLEDAEVAKVLELAYDRENAAKARRAHLATAFFEHVTDALGGLIEKTAAEQGKGTPAERD